MWEHDYKWVPLVPKTNGYFNRMCHIYFISAIALVFGINAKINIKNQFLGEMHMFWVSSISLCLVGEMA